MCFQRPVLNSNRVLKRLVSDMESAKTSQASTCSSSHETELGEVNHDFVQKELQNSSKKRQSYVKYTPEDRYEIGKYASENGPISSVRKFKIKFPKLNESTARTFRSKYESELAEAKKKGRPAATSIILKPQGRPLLLGGIDDMVQRYILAASNRGGVISR